MPAIAHLAPRLLGSSDSGGITPTAIGLIVGIAIVPAILLLWVCFWLMICYPHDRTCLCVKSRKRKAREDLGEKGVNVDASQEIVYGNPVHDVQRPVANHRTDSGTPGGVNRLTKAEPLKTQATRMSVQSVGSNSTIAVQQEPKPFV